LFTVRIETAVLPPMTAFAAPVPAVAKLVTAALTAPVPSPS
jgi:hypothetical protein